MKQEKEYREGQHCKECKMYGKPHKIRGEPLSNLHPISKDEEEWRKNNL